ncbi:T9SS type A sorting domain-containing protein [Sanyastnella coralliicola]|uniref:T9SS type A sorting domain-containing protein n=1 Tax=Sanyastnella coralliicola TaxID=3069118 RepID=UPI0027B8FD12|nr:T9SS type A sorting domain-containing protein [Longitalea sp. SCSIO 12813]
MKRTILSLALLMLCFPVLSQDCYNVYLGLDSYIAQGGPEAVFWELVDNENTLIESGVAQYSMNDPYYDQVLCLEPGCYTLNAEVNGFFNPLGIEAYLESDNGEINDLMISMLDLGLAIEFCVSAPAVDCPETISFEQVGEECAVYIATVDGYDGPVIWDATGFGAFDGDESYMFDFWNEGVYDVCATILTDDCETTICTSITIDCFDNCELYVGLEQETDCGPFLFYGENENPELPIWWWVEGLNIQSEGSYFTFMPEEAGVYTVCASNESELCPWGDVSCFTIEVPEGCFAQECPETISFQQVGEECAVYIAAVDGYEGPVIWEATGFDTFEGNESYMFDFWNEGVYEVCATIISDDCETTICNTITIDCFNECEVDVFVSEFDCGIEFDVDWTNADWFGWYVDGLLVSEMDLGFSFFPEVYGTYDLCFVYESIECGGQEWCYNYTPSEECFAQSCELYVTVVEETDCAFVFYGENENPDLPIWWWVEGLNIQNEGPFFTFSPDEPGEYTICASNESELCPWGNVTCYTVEVPEGCFSEECEFEIIVDQFDCGSFFVSLDGDYDESGVNWYLDEELYMESSGFTNVNLPNNGAYQLCVTYESEDCSTEQCVTLYAEGCVEECTEVQGSMTSWVSEGGPVYVDWTLYTAEEEVLLNGIEQFSEDDPVAFIDFCLEEGCYIYEVFNPNGELDSESFSVGLGGVLGLVEVTNLIQLDQYIVFEFCVESTLGYPEGDCPDPEIWAGGNCGEWAFEIGSFQEGEQAIWSFGDGTVMEGGHFITHEFDEPGSYDVCVEFWSDECEGVYACTTIYVEDCVNSCDVDVYVTEMDCSIIFDAATVPSDNYGWYVNGELVSENELALFFDPEYAGYYEFCLVYENEECGTQEWCYSTVFEEDCFSDECFLEITYTMNDDCGPFVFLGATYDPNTPIWWWVEGQNIESEGNAFTFMPEEAGVYTICAGIETPECPFGTTECITIEVPEGCFETEDCTLYGEVEALTCDVWLLELGGNLPWEVIPGIWLDNEYYGQGMSATFLLEPGWHTVCAGYESEACEGEVEWCTEFYVEECECPYYVESWVDGCQVFLEIPQADPNAEVLWEVNGVTYEGGSVLDVIVSENGYYTGCAVYNDPFCQDLVLCFDFGIDGCEEETDCFLQVDYQLIEGTTYLFEANAPDNATVWWSINDEVIESGNLFDYEFNAFGQYEICAFYETPECPEGVWECVNIVVADEFDCTPVVIYFDAIDELDVDVDIEYIIEGLGFELEGLITIQEECGSTILELCVPDGCYQVTMSLEEFEDLALYLAIFIDNGLPIEYDIDFLNQTVTIEMGVNDDCATDIASAELESLSLFPNPVNETLNVVYPNGNNDQWMIFDSKGSLVEQGNLNEFGVLKLNTSHLESGAYVLRIEGNTKVLTQRFQVIH